MRPRIRIVGTGFAGSVMARCLADSCEARIEMIEARTHIAGQCFDRHEEHGILVHEFGPHYFRTNDDEVFAFLSRFTDWVPGNYYIKSSVGGKLYQFPVNLNTMEQILGNPVSEEGFLEYLKENRVSFEKITNAEEQCLSLVGRELYEMFYRGYTQKQWGVPPDRLLPEITARIPLRYNRIDSYVTAKHMAMPRDGYTKLFERLLDHPRIHIELNRDYVPASSDEEGVLVYTGPLDRFFDYSEGPLRYRSLRFESEYDPADFRQPCVQINYPNDHEYTRTVEIKHVTAQQCPGTVITREYPVDGGDPFYPFLDAENRLRADRYRARADKAKEHGIFFVGRLAEFRYYDMDHVIKRSLNLFREEVRPCLERKYGVRFKP